MQSKKLNNIQNTGFIGILILIIIIFFISLGSYFYIQFKTVPCNRTIYYDIGKIDSKFNISKQDTLENIKIAEKLWEDAVEKNLFEFKQGADFKINLIYDERQAQADATRDKISSTETSIGNLKNLQQQYNKMEEIYQKKVTEYEKDVAYWNSQGGAPEHEFNRLETQRNEINTSAKQLNNLGRNINNLAKELNVDIDEINSKAGKTYEKGVYDKDIINIFEFENSDDLILTLAHEFGHALGIDHLENEDALMHFLLNDKNSKEVKISQADKNALSELCEVNYLSFDFYKLKDALLNL